MRFTKNARLLQNLLLSLIFSLGLSVSLTLVSATTLEKGVCLNQEPVGLFVQTSEEHFVTCCERLLAAVLNEMPESDRPVDIDETLKKEFFTHMHHLASEQQRITGSVPLEWFEPRFRNEWARFAAHKIHLHSLFSVMRLGVLGLCFVDQVMLLCLDQSLLVVICDFFRVGSLVCYGTAVGLGAVFSVGVIGRDAISGAQLLSSRWGKIEKVSGPLVVGLSAANIIHFYRS